MSHSLYRKGVTLPTDGMKHGWLGWSELGLQILKKITSLSLYFELRSCIKVGKEHEQIYNNVSKYQTQLNNKIGKDHRQLCNKVGKDHKKTMIE